MDSGGEPLSEHKRESSSSRGGQFREPEQPENPEVEVAHSSLPFPVVNQPAKICMALGVGTTIWVIVAFATDGIWTRYVTEGVVILCVGLFSAFGVFCGHCACRQIRLRRPKQKGAALALIGIVLNYIWVGLFIYAVWLLTQGTV